MNTIYVRRSDGVYASFDGMSIEVVSRLLAEMNLTGEVIDEGTFTAHVVKKMAEREARFGA